MEYELYNNKLGTWLLTPDHSVQDQIMLGNFWETELEPIFEKLKPTDVVLEVGSYMGDHTILLSKKCEKVYAFEANTPNFYQLCANLLLNDCTNVEVYNMCMGAVSGKVTKERAPSIWSRACNVYNLDVDGTIPLFTLDDTLTHLDKLDYFKVDAEGSDLNVLLGARDIIKKFKPFINFEFNDTASPQPLTEYYEYLESFGYVITRLGVWNWSAELK